MKVKSENYKKIEKRVIICWTVVVVLGYLSFFIFKNLKASVLLGLVGSWGVAIYAYFALKNIASKIERLVILISIIALLLVGVLYYLSVFTSLFAIEKI